jgi:hypothetical protein
LAKTHLLWEDQQVVKQKRLDAAVKALEVESQHWITLENVDDKITAALFDVAGTSTGLKTPFSDFMGFQTFVPSLKRMLTDNAYMNGNAPFGGESSNKRSAIDHNADELIEKLEELERQKTVLHRMSVENFLDASIEDGEERSKYKELLNAYMKTFYEGKSFEELDHEIEEAAELTNLVGGPSRNYDYTLDDDVEDDFDDVEDDTESIPESVSEDDFEEDVEDHEFDEKKKK